MILAIQCSGPSREISVLLKVKNYRSSRPQVRTAARSNLFPACCKVGRTRCVSLRALLFPAVPHLTLYICGPAIISSSVAIRVALSKTPVPSSHFLACPDADRFVTRRQSCLAGTKCYRFRRPLHEIDSYLVHSPAASPARCRRRPLSSVAAPTSEALPILTLISTMTVVKTWSIPPLHPPVRAASVSCSATATAPMRRPSFMRRQAAPQPVSEQQEWRLPSAGNLRARQQCHQHGGR
jgi:hypothetical protein